MIARVFALLIAMALQFLPRTLVAQDELLERISTLGQEIDASSQALSDIQARSVRLQKDLDLIDAQITKAELRRTELQDQLEGIKEQRVELEEKARQSDLKVKKLQSLSVQRLKMLYMYGAGSGLKSVNLVSSHESLQRSAFYFSKLRDFDFRLMRELSEMRERAASQHDQLGVAEEQQQRLKNEAAQQADTLSKQREEQAQLKAALKKESEQREAALSSKRAQMLRLETVLASLTNSGEAPSAGARNIKTQSNLRDISAYRGEGLAQFRGRLTLPIDGDVKVQSGKIASLSNKAFGLILSVSKVSEVRAIKDGKVMFVGRLPEYGAVVIIDHGQRYYSLYGGLGLVAVSDQQKVDTSELIGKTSDPSGSDSNLYFEIRKEGLVIDARPYFKKS